MIPLLHLISFINVLFCFFTVRRLYFSYQKTKNLNIGDFLKAYIVLGIFFFLVSLPAIIFDPKQVQVAYILSYIPVILSATFLLRVAFRILNYRFWAEYISFFIYPLIVMITILNAIFFSPAYVAFSGGLFYHWVETTVVWLQMLNGFLIGFLAAGCALLFLLGGIRSENRLVRIRAFRIGAGISLLLIATLLNYALAPRGRLEEWPMVWWFSVAASLIALAGLALILSGIYYRIKEKSF